MGDHEIRIGTSSKTDAVLAVRELCTQLAQDEPALVGFFCSPRYDLQSLARSISDAFPDTDVIGCTTAGEIGVCGYLDGGLVGFSMARSVGAVAVEAFSNLGNLSMVAVEARVEELRRGLERQVGPLTPDNAFALLLIDGMSRREEPVVRTIHGALGGIPIAGGSAADGLDFRRTFIFHGGRFRQDGAVLALVHSRRPFSVFKTQHFRRSSERMVVTEALPAIRTVTEINGAPAAAEYARVVGMQVDKLDPMIFAAHPVVVKIGDAEYVRSIQQVNPDGSLTFFCAIDTGMVLTVSEGVDLVDNLRHAFEGVAAEIGVPQVILGWDCILRNLEVRQKGLIEDVSNLLTQSRVIGFCTYGEQFNGMHVNQTFTGIAIGAAR